MATKINIRSPYYLKYTDPSLTKVELDVYVYEGTVQVDKGNAVYELSNDVINGTDYVVFEVSEFVRDYFDFSFDGVNYSSRTQWLSVEARLFNDTTLLSTQTADYLAFDGYTSYTDGLNAEGSRDLLQTSQRVKIVEGQSIKVPVYSEEVVSVIAYRYIDDSTDSQSRWNEETQNWEVNEDFWANEASSTVSVVTDTLALSQGKIAYFEIDSQTGRVDILTDSTSKTIIVDVVEPCKWGSRKVTFINKHGAYEDFWFDGAAKDSVQYKESTYKAAKIDFDTMSYNQQSGQVKRYDVNSNVKRTLNTGWVSELQNSAIEEMLMSEAVWITEDGQTLPVIPVNKSLQKIKHIDKNLINYKLDFMLAFDNNNSVI